MGSCSSRANNKFEDSLDIKHPYMKNKLRKINFSQHGVAYRQNINTSFSIALSTYFNNLMMNNFMFIRKITVHIFEKSDLIIQIIKSKFLCGKIL